MPDGRRSAIPSVTLVGWNPMNLLGANYRDYEVARFFHWCGVIACAGTKVRQIGCEAHHVLDLDTHTCIHFGWRASTMVNNSCGCSILISKKRFKSRNYAVLPTPADLQGRVAAVLIRQNEVALLVIVLYFPPRSRSYSKATYLRTIHAMLRWLTRLLVSTPVRVTPFLYMDANTDLAEPQGVTDSTVVGTKRREPNEAGKLIFEALYGQKIDLINTYCDHGPTFFAPTWHFAD